jgi:L-lactate dehydrogenase complex protein LldE
MRVSIFITCLVDQFHPEVGQAMLAVLDRLGIGYDFPPRQTCCGQPAFNSGCRDDATRVARQFVSAFAGCELIVAPSGSCVEMVKKHVPALFADGSRERQEAERVAARVREFSDFLVNVVRVIDVGARFPHRVTYHDSCHLLRGLGIRQEPRALLAAVHEASVVDLPASDTCCGFGGTFAVKYPAISGEMGREKLRYAMQTGAEYLVACDTGCLMHLRGMIAREQMPLRALHLAEVLAST